VSRTPEKFLRLNGPSFDELLKTVTPIITKRHATSDYSNVYPVRYSLWPLEIRTFEDLKFVSAMSPQSTGVIVLETCLLLGRQAMTG
jgi:hypothetical protein